VEDLLVAIAVVGFPSLHRKLAVGNRFAAELAPETLGMPILPHAAQEATIAKRLLTPRAAFRRARSTGSTSTLQKKVEDKATKEINQS